MQLEAGIQSGSPLLSSQIHRGVTDRERDGKGAGAAVTDVLPLLPAPRSCLRAGSSKHPRIRAIPCFVIGNHHQPPSTLPSPFPLFFPCFLSSYLFVPLFSVASGPRFLGSDYLPPSFPTYLGVRKRGQDLVRAALAPELSRSASARTSHIFPLCPAA